VSSTVSALNNTPSSSYSQFSLMNKHVQCNNSLSIGHLDNELHIWHLRLGHAHNKAVQTVLDWCKIPHSNKNVIDFCTYCCIGKSHRLHAPLSTTVYTKPFEVIHCDLWGPAPVTSYYGYNYYITFVDTYTKYTWIYFLKHKSDALKAFTQFSSFIQNQFKSTIKALQSDWGVSLGPLLHY
jgi:histone deacetylase 1/2